jgi:hypothetical protein
VGLGIVVLDVGEFGGVLERIVLPVAISDPSEMTLACSAKDNAAAIVVPVEICILGSEAEDTRRPNPKLSVSKSYLKAAQHSCRGEV